ncbi:MAG: glycoside hydrolase family 99-like domain-containing protein, partial [Bacteroidales bacterium]|nr:glycoside hydrolase family 99-like domain-containing protein [Bacteroidales bacterium]
MMKVYYNLLLLIAILPIQYKAQAQIPDTVIKIGAIRWDWATGGSVNEVVEKTLGPKHWHYRVPFFGEIINDSAIAATCISQPCIDREILYAKENGLDYFAYLLYEESDPMTIPLNRFLTSGYKSEMNFAVIGPKSVERIIRYFKDPSYQTVLNGRPLYFIYQNERDEDHSVELKAACAAEGIPEPYIVVMQDNPTMPSEWDFDAITRYWYGPHVYGGLKTGAPYSTLVNSARNDWAARVNTSATQVPMVSAGADGRPRVETETPWVDDPWFYEYYFMNPTPDELASHMADAINFVRQNPVSCESGAILIYSWNENDEGGWLTPTLDPTGQVDDSRLRKIKQQVAPVDPGNMSSL